VALAGDHKVIVTVEPELDGLAHFVCRHRRPHGQVASLCFFTTKASAHAAAFHTHLVVVQAQRMCHPVLHLAWVLCAAMYDPLVLLLWNGVGNLAFEVKVLLTAHFKMALQGVRGLGQRLTSVATPHVHGW